MVKALLLWGLLPVTSLYTSQSTLVDSVSVDFSEKCTVHFFVALYDVINSSVLASVQ